MTKEEMDNFFKKLHSFAGESVSVEFKPTYTFCKIKTKFGEFSFLTHQEDPFDVFGLELNTVYDKKKTIEAIKKLVGKK